jgi:plasmid maintenance system antidote protein VapI
MNDKENFSERAALARGKRTTKPPSAEEVSRRVIRRDNFNRLLVERFGGNKARMADAMGVAPTTVYRYSNGQMDVTETKAVELEGLFGLADGYFEVFQENPITVDSVRTVVRQRPSPERVARWVSDDKNHDNPLGAGAEALRLFSLFCAKTDDIEKIRKLGDAIKAITDAFCGLKESPAPPQGQPSNDETKDSERVG